MSEWDVADRNLADIPDPSSACLLSEAKRTRLDFIPFDELATSNPLDLEKTCKRMQANRK